MFTALYQSPLIVSESHSATQELAEDSLKHGITKKTYVHLKWMPLLDASYRTVRLEKELLGDASQKNHPRSLMVLGPGVQGTWGAQEVRQTCPVEETSSPHSVTVSIFVIALGQW